jgi:hypothetical protein
MIKIYPIPIYLILLQNKTLILFHQCSKSELKLDDFLLLQSLSSIFFSIHYHTMIFKCYIRKVISMIILLYQFAIKSILNASVHTFMPFKLISFIIMNFFLITNLMKDQPSPLKIFYFILTQLEIWLYLYFSGYFAALEYLFYDFQKLLHNLTMRISYNLLKLV